MFTIRRTSQDTVCPVFAAPAVGTFPVASAAADSGRAGTTSSRPDGAHRTRERSLDVLDSLATPMAAVPKSGLGGERENESRSVAPVGNSATLISPAGTAVTPLAGGPVPLGQGNRQSAGHWELGRPHNGPALLLNQAAATLHGTSKAAPRSRTTAAPTTSAAGGIMISRTLTVTAGSATTSLGRHPVGGRRTPGDLDLTCAGASLPSRRRDRKSVV